MKRLIERERREREERERERGERREERGERREERGERREERGERREVFRHRAIILCEIRVRYPVRLHPLLNIIFGNFSCINKFC
jgi:hypothetical protein